MYSIAKIDDEPNKHKVHSQYAACSKYQKKRFHMDYEIKKEYEHFYLCVKLDYNGNELYRECFSKFDVDGADKARKIHGPIFKF